MGCVNDFYEEAYQYVMNYEKPFNFINKYYALIISPKCLWGQNHESWIDYSLDKYNQYRHARFTDEESQVNSMLDTLEAIIEASEKK